MTWRRSRSPRVPMACVLALAGAVACSWPSDHEVTPWLKVERTRAHFTIPHLLEAGEKDVVYIRASRHSKWRKVYEENYISFVVAGHGRAVAATTSGIRGWMVFDEGGSIPAQLPPDVWSSSSASGHPERAAFFFSNYRSNSTWEGLEVLEVRSDGSLARSWRAAPPDLGSKPDLGSYGQAYVVAVTSDDRPLLAQNVRLGGKQVCLLMRVDGDVAEVVTRVPADGHFDCTKSSILDLLMARRDLKRTNLRL